MRTPPGTRRSPAALRQRRATILTRLPPLTDVLRGSFLRREIRCGKPTCHCATGPGHPLRYVTVTLAPGRTQQVTVPPHLARTVQRWIRHYQQWWRAMEEISTINRELLQRREISGIAPAPPRPRGRR
jgi:hypothetical protein